MTGDRARDRAAACTDECVRASNDTAVGDGRPGAKGDRARYREIAASDRYVRIFGIER